MRNLRIQKLACGACILKEDRFRKQCGYGDDNMHVH